MSQIKWLPEALADIERLYIFLHDKNPQAAMRTAKAILDGTDFLMSMPDVGRPMDDNTGRREWFISFGVALMFCVIGAKAMIPSLLSGSGITGEIAYKLYVDHRQPLSFAQNGHAKLAGFFGFAASILTDNDKIGFGRYRAADIGAQ